MRRQLIFAVAAAVASHGYVGYTETQLASMNMGNAHKQANQGHDKVANPSAGATLLSGNLPKPRRPAEYIDALLVLPRGA